MKKLLVLTGLWLLASCGSDSWPPKKPERADIYEVHEELEPYIQEFIEEAAIRGVEVEITDLMATFVDELQGRAVGTCYHTSPPVIAVKRSYWDVLDPRRRSVLMAHELGHCILGYGHTTKDQLSIMRPSVLAYEEVQDNHAYLWDELFNPSRSTQYFLALAKELLEDADKLIKGGRHDD